MKLEVSERMKQWHITSQTFQCKLLDFIIHFLVVKNIVPWLAAERDTYAAWCSKPVSPKTVNECSIRVLSM